jgi:hypothetical protein
MSKKIRITENQLKSLITNKNRQIVEEKTENVKQKVEIVKPIVNESIEKIKSDFKRFL